MKSDKANSYNTFVDEGLVSFWLFFHQNIELSNSKEEIETMKRKYQAENFEDCFLEFKNEFEENVHEFPDRKSIYYYVEDCFGEWDEWNGFEPDIERTIIRSHYEVPFLLKLLKTLQEHIFNMTSLIFVDPITFDLSLNFEKSFYDAIITVDPNYEMPFETLNGHKSEIYFVYDNRFDFESLKIECNQLKTKPDKIQLIEERLIEFSQWQVQYDEMIYDEGVGSYRPNTLQYYSSFEELCELELKKLNKKLEFENKLIPNESIPVAFQGDNQPFDFIWKDSDTDLLELMISLQKNESIQRKDGKPINRNELVSCFETMFSFKIKDVEGKLTRATGRVDNTPFLDRLKIAFKKFGEEKEAKYKKLHSENKK